MAIKRPGQSSSNSDSNPPQPPHPPFPQQSSSSNIPPPARTPEPQPVPTVTRQPSTLNATPPAEDPPETQQYEDGGYDDVDPATPPEEVTDTKNEELAPAESGGWRRRTVYKAIALVLIGLILVGMGLVGIEIVKSHYSTNKTAAIDEDSNTAPTATQIVPTATPTVTAVATNSAPPVPVVTDAPPVAAPKQVCVPVTADLLRKFFFQNDPSCMVGRFGRTDPTHLTLNCSVDAPFDEGKKCTDVSKCMVCLPDSFAPRGEERAFDFNVETLKVFTPQLDPSCFVNPNLEAFHKATDDGLRIDKCTSFSYDPVRGCYDYSQCKMIVPALAAADAAPAASSR